MNTRIFINADKPFRPRTHGSQRHIGGGVAGGRPVQGERLRRMSDGKGAVFARNRFAVSRLIGAAWRFHR